MPYLRNRVTREVRRFNLELDDPKRYREYLSKEEWEPVEVFTSSQLATARERPDYHFVGAAAPVSFAEVKQDVEAARKRAKVENADQRREALLELLEDLPSTADPQLIAVAIDAAGYRK